MSRGKSSSSKPKSRDAIGATLLPLGNVACGIFYYVACFAVVNDVYGQATLSGRRAAEDSVGSIFMVCLIGLAIGAVQAAAIRRRRPERNDRSPSTTADIRWPLATMAGYFAWAISTKILFSLFGPTFSSVESYVMLTSERIVSMFLLILAEGVILPGLTIGYAQYLALPHKTDKAYKWPLIQMFGLFLAVAAPVLLPALIIYPIAAANPDSDGSVIVLTMFIGFPAWLLLSSVFGCLSIWFTNLWLFENVFPLRTSMRG